MKVTGAFAAVTLASTASAANVPSRVEARATGSSGAAIPTVTTRGNAFYAGEERFYIRGIDYQPGGSSEASDPLADPTVCKRDIPYFKDLGVNTVRVYTVDNSASHDECMDALAEAGIYLALDVNSPLYSLNRDDPAVSYNAMYLQSVFATIDAFAGYNNTLLFFSGNEVINAPNTTNTAPFVKAVTRDMKQYIAERGYRSLAVGYSAADVAENQYLMAQYMDCGETQTRSDFYAINNYEWCGESSFTQSGWDALVEQYRNYSLPLFLSEYGCIDPAPRNFQDTVALYQPDMTVAVSGGCLYEYSQSGNGYGIVNINGNSVTAVGDQFSGFKSALAAVKNPSGSGGAHASTKAQKCPSQGVNWNTHPFHGDALPAIPSGALKYFQSGAGKGPGLSGPGSQNAGTNNIATASKGAGKATATLGNGPTGGLTINGAQAASGTATATKSSAASAGLLAPADFRPFFVCSLAMMVSFALGAFAL